MTAVFTEHTLQVDGSQIRYLEAGQGDPIVVLCNLKELTQSSFFTLLAQRRRVIAFEFFGSHRSPVEDRPAITRDAVRRLAQALTAVGLDHYVLIGVAASAPLALRQALDAREHIDALVLISPSVPPPAGRTATSDTIAGPLTCVAGRGPNADIRDTRHDDASIPPETGRLYAGRCLTVIK
jgi:pimeloyl-ACP methyl ester carboxylesterase